MTPGAGAVRVLAVTACLLAGVSGWGGTRGGASPGPPAALRAHPSAAGTKLPLAAQFTLADAGGKPVSLASYRGRPVALLFFCGCPWCTRFAQAWGRFQRGGVLGTTPTADPVTLVVFSGDAAAVTEFAGQTGLDPRRTVLLPDPTMRVTNAYRADPCPRAFVVDGRGAVRYTNEHADDAPRSAPALSIASRALDALRACALAPAGKGAHPGAGPGGGKRNRPARVSAAGRG